MINYLVQNFILLICVFGMLILLAVFPLKSKKLQVTMIITLSLVFLLSFASYMDDYFSDYDTFTYGRVIFSYMSYTLKVACIGSLLLLFVNKKKDFIIIIGLTLLNDLVYSLMFFTRLVVWFSETNSFNRGPLGFFFFIPSAVYFLMLFAEVYKRNRIGKIREAGFVLVVALFILLAAIIEIESDDIKTYTGSVIALSSIFLFIEIYFSNELYDTVTELLGRKSYTRDITMRWKSIDCVVSLDLNNLKKINDEKGHEAGDLALNTLGKCMRKVCNDYTEKKRRNFVAYRIGGDEMAVLIYRKFNKKLNPSEVEDLIRDIQNEVVANGYGVACGYAMNDKSKLINEILDLADKNMYINKKEIKENLSAEKK